MLSPSIEVKPSTDTINKMKEIEHLDCILSSNIFNYIGEYWAKGTSYNNYLVSPIYGGFNNLGRLHIFMGTSEIFYVYINRFLHKIYESNSIVKYYEGKNMMHTLQSYLVVRKVMSLLSDIRYYKKLKAIY